jgi:hypothetical protein
VGEAAAGDLEELGAEWIRDGQPSDYLAALHIFSMVPPPASKLSAISRRWSLTSNE